MCWWLQYRVARAIGDLVRDQTSASSRGEEYILPDERARQSAMAKLTDDASIDLRKVELLVLSGELILRGNVPTASMKQRAEQICSAIAGVRAVRNELQVH